MKTRDNFNLLNKLFLLMFALVVSTTMSFAAVNSLSGIDVKEVGNDNYNIMLKVDNAANIKKIQNEKDNLTIVLNSTVPTDSVEIVYDNAADLDNVIVQKKNNDSTIILLQGRNIENAKVFTKELSTGITTQKDANENILNSYFLIADKKVTFASVIGFFAFLFLMLSFKQKRQRASYKQVNSKIAKTNKKVTVNTLRNKNLHQSRNIPSINYRVNGSARASMSVPKDFVINNYVHQELEPIRKAG